MTAAACVVDPRSDGAITAAMRALLTDDDLHARLVAERLRPTGADLVGLRRGTLGPGGRAVAGDRAVIARSTDERVRLVLSTLTESERTGGPPTGRCWAGCLPTAGTTPSG